MKKHRNRTVWKPSFFFDRLNFDDPNIDVLEIDCIENSI